jgi:hypothetical protein
MKVYKYLEFLLEGNTPEDYILDALNKIHKRLEAAFKGDEDQVKKMSDFQKYNLQLIEIEPPSNYNYSRKNLKIKFMDDEQNMYHFNVTMNVEDAVKNKQEGGDMDFQTSDIKKCQVAFTKYSIGEDDKMDKDPMLSKTVDPESIDADFLIKIKIDLDEGKDPTQEEEFKIETEDNLPPEENQQPAQGEQQPSAGGQTSIQNTAQPNSNTQTPQQPAQGTGI